VTDRLPPQPPRRRRAHGLRPVRVAAGVSFLVLSALSRCSVEIPDLPGETTGGETTDSSGLDGDDFGAREFGDPCAISVECVAGLICTAIESETDGDFPIDDSALVCAQCGGDSDCPPERFCVAGLCQIRPPEPGDTGDTGDTGDGDTADTTDVAETASDTDTGDAGTTTGGSDDSGDADDTTGTLDTTETSGTAITDTTGGETTDTTASTTDTTGGDTTDTAGTTDTTTTTDDTTTDGWPTDPLPVGVPCTLGPATVDSAECLAVDPRLHFCANLGSGPTCFECGESDDCKGNPFGRHCFGVAMSGSQPTDMTCGCVPSRGNADCPNGRTCTARDGGVRGLCQ
jgi:hypothetical protein